MDLAAENLFRLYSEMPVAKNCDRYHIALHLGELKDGSAEKGPQAALRYSF